MFKEFADTRRTSISINRISPLLSEFEILKMLFKSQANIKLGLPKNREQFIVDTYARNTGFGKILSQ